MSLHLGSEVFDIHKVDIQSDFNHLFIREGSGLQGQAVFKTKLTFRQITMSLADKTDKSQKVALRIPCCHQMLGSVIPLR
ncbi:unnamed protein product [Protopolystoma xenopodis]|uniref:Uncharacterized protein n=1 Tax=Protopolystoma xenopodis TaxID=117903 RepID=A0A3S5BM49_9PLAT|nr:unnamed protein product [Protopolystoma xenopodis]